MVDTPLFRDHPEALAHIDMDQDFVLPPDEVVKAIVALISSQKYASGTVLEVGDIGGWREVHLLDDPGPQGRSTLPRTKARDAKLLVEQALSTDAKAIPKTLTEQVSTNNAAAAGVTFFTPQHGLSPGTPKTVDDTTPTIFRPLKVRGVTLRNRICVSPMCNYSCAPTGAEQGVLTPLYFTTIGHYAYKGAALVMIEATGVQANGRISVNCPGLYNDAQEKAFKTIADFVHSHGGLIGVQLSHGGRKSSTLAPWIASRLGKGSARADTADWGWPDQVVGPMGGPTNSWDGKAGDDPSGGFCEPRQMTLKDIEGLVADWASSAKRAAAAGVDVVEIHVAHGYLLHQFLSPITNQRNDKYGGSFENRIHLTVEVIRAVRAVVPQTMPVVVRISATDWMEDTDIGNRLGSWDVDSTVRLAKMLPGLGVDILDVSSGGNHPAARFTVFNAGKEQAEIANRIRKEMKDAGLSLLVSAVGEITNSQQARDLVQLDMQGNSAADLIFVGRQFLKDPAWVMTVAQQLGVDVAWPVQISRPQILGSKA